MSSTAFIVQPEWVATVEPGEPVLRDHAVAVQDGSILGVLPAAQARQTYPDLTVIERPGHLLVPGFINAHTHAAMSLMRGFADDLPLQTWLNDRIWPAEGKWVSEDFVFDGAVLACHEMLLGGTTLFNDMYFFPESTARAATALGMRASLGIIVFDFPSAYGAGPDDYLRKGISLRDQYRDNSTVSFAVAPHAPYTVSDPVFARVVTLANELQLPIHIHLHETAFEVEESVRAHGVRPLERLNRLGLLTPQLMAVHSVHMNDEDIDQLGASNCSVVHCPHSNLKLGSGIAPTGKMLQAGINLAIGTDGSASNNRLDLIAEARTGALLAKGAAQDAACFSAWQALQALTIGGARALGLEDRLGSIRAGKRADLVSIDLGGPQTQPVFDPVSQLIYTADRTNVSDVWIDGGHVVHKQRLVNSSSQSTLSEVVSRIGVWQNRLSEVVDH